MSCSLTRGSSVASTTSTSTGGSIANTISDAANCTSLSHPEPLGRPTTSTVRLTRLFNSDVSETVQETISGAKKEGNKEVAYVVLHILSFGS